MSPLVWDPSPVAFSIPWLNLSIHWYGVFFALGLLSSIWLGTLLLKKYIFPDLPTKDLSQLTDHLFFSLFLGILVGARIGHVCFYDWSYYSTHPAEIIKIWEGGLASHGGAIGVLLSTWYFSKKQKLFSKYHVRTIQIFDIIALSTFPAATCIRIGNFFNQEIIGLPSSMPWAVLFKHPLGTSGENVARHPVQLYEACAYLLIGLGLLSLKNKILSKPGLGLGLSFISIFTTRFFLEYCKASQSSADEYALLSTGQFLSLPFIACGILLTLRARRSP